MAANRGVLGSWARESWSSFRAQARVAARRVSCSVWDSAWEARARRAVRVAGLCSNGGMGEG